MNIVTIARIERFGKKLVILEMLQKKKPLLKETRTDSKSFRYALSRKFSISEAFPGFNENLKGKAMNLFNEVKDHVDAASVARFYGLQINKNKMACCPFHNDKHPSIKIDKTYYCFGCGEKGDAINYVAKMFGLSQIDAAKKITSDMSLPIQVDLPKRKKKPPASIRKKKKLEEVLIEGIKKEFHHWCIDKTHKFLEALNLIQSVKDYLTDKEPDMVMHSEAFAELLHAEPVLNHWLDILCFGTEEEQKEFFLQKHKEVTELEQRLFRAGKTILESDWDRTEQRKCG